MLAKATRRMSRRRRGREDERWYWAALPLLDRAFNQKPVQMWLEVSDEALAWRSVLDRETEDAGDDSAGEARRFREHVDEFVKAFGGQLDPPLGPQPDDLADVLTYVALGSPAVAMLRT